jgi:hypothetical protein
MNEKKIYQILELCLWILNPLILVLAIYNQKILPGLFLQWIGRFHPLVLHFPIVFGMLIATYYLFFQHRKFSVDTEKLLLAINALITSGVVLCGLLLSAQGAYDANLIFFHKWGGIGITILSWLFLYVSDIRIRLKKYLALMFLVVLIGATHKGAQLTHGVNALSFPQVTISATENRSATDSLATLYEVGIAPILAGKCVGCHGNDKIKGDLQLNTPENILKGGKHGDILKGDLIKTSLMIERIHLPQADERHMPPDGKLQLTKEETTILNNWIKGGANFKIKLIQLPLNDSLRLLTTNSAYTNQKFERKTNLPDLNEFNSNYCTTNYLFNGSDRIEVNFFQGSNYKHEDLRKLEKIKNKIVSLNMQGMPLKKEDLDLIIQFNNLQNVNLNNTGLDLTALGTLKSLPALKSVSICGIEFDEAVLDKFLDHAKFSELNVWTKNGTQKQLEKIILKYPAIKISVGDNLADEIVKISNPTIEQDSLIIADHLDVKLKHLLKGVIIRYSTDGTEPDSIKSTEYKEPFRLSQNTVLKIKAYRQGWKSSDVVQQTFYKSEIHPDSIYLLTNPDPKHRGNGAKTLIDYDLGVNNRYTDKWLGYKDSNMELIIGFNQTKRLNSAYFNAYVETGASIFPIKAITVQGSDDGTQFKKISEAKFPEANKTDPSGARTFTCNFPKGTTYKYYKFSVSNLKKMPLWKKDDKGKPAWIFVDELFLN